MVPSTAAIDPAFDPENFRRGPKWGAVNWFLYKGLRSYGYDDAANNLKKKTHELIQRSGFREYYNPMTGKGLGAHDFTWMGLVLDME